MKGTIPGFNPFGPPPAPVLEAKTGANLLQKGPVTVTVPGFNPFTTSDQGFIPVMQPAAVDVNNPCSQLPFYGAMKACTACTARPEAMQVVPGKGPLDARMLFIGQNPGDDEDRAGTPFVGQSGEEFDSWMAVLGLDRAKAVVTFVVKCHTTKNRVPRTKELRICSDLWLSQELAALTQVSVIITLGKPAAVAVLTRSAPPTTPLMVHHYTARSGGRDLHIFPLPHPAYLLRARHLAPMFRETILGQLKLTLQQETPDAYTWTQR